MSEYGFGRCNAKQDALPDALGTVTLTAREREVLQRLVQGESNRQIARSLAIAPSTARTHTQNVLMKLGVQSRVQAASLVAPVAPPGATLPGRGDGSAGALTHREHEVLAGMVAGASRTSIAARLNLSPHTVRTHVRRILAKLGVHSTPEAAALLRRHRHGPRGLEPQPVTQAA
jgi:DNA-binding CsgD family transcriptional regulator